MEGDLKSILAQVRTGRVSVEQRAIATLEKAAAYDQVQPQVWISRLPTEAVIAAATERAEEGGA